MPPNCIYGNIMVQIPLVFHSKMYAQPIDLKTQWHSVKYTQRLHAKCIRKHRKLCA